MNVQQLIDELQKIEDKTLEVCLPIVDQEYTDEEGEECTIFEPVSEVCIADAPSIFPNKFVWLDACDFKDESEAAS